MQIEECDDDDEKNDDKSDDDDENDDKNDDDEKNDDKDDSTCGVGGKVGGEHALDVVAIVKNIFIVMVIITPTLR